MKSPSFLIICLCLFSFSCEKVIELDLEDSDRQIVIEAQLQAGNNQFTVLVSQSSNYFSNEAPVLISDAKVVLYDNSNSSINLPLLKAGEYGGEINAEAGMTYSLEVELDGQVYQANTTVPTPVLLNTLDTTFLEATAFFDEGYQVVSRFEDDPLTENYYRVLHAIDEVWQKDGTDLQVTNDRFFNGSENARLPVFNHIFSSGEIITVTLQHLDKVSFEYFNSLANIVGDGQGPNGGTAAPGNPPSNWSGDALGYFGAVAGDTRSILLP
ncbi:MAG: DUF4249 domain-containing protein [Bacteroidota bacterium]